MFENDVPWLSEVKYRTEPLPEGTIDLDELLFDEENGQIDSRIAWEQKREIIKERWLTYLGKLSSNSDNPDGVVIKEERTNGVVRRLVEYKSESDRVIPGYLIMPSDVTRAPGIVAFHATTDSTIKQPAGLDNKRPELSFGLKLAKRGFVVFCPECFLWHGQDELDATAKTQEFKNRHPNSTGMAKMLFDAQRGVDYLESLEVVDKNRIGAIGHSLGAKEALYLTALDKRVRTAVFSEGGIGIDHSNWNDPWYLGEPITDFEHQHHEILSLIAPRPFLLIGGNAADGIHSWPYVEAVQPIYDLYTAPRRIGILNHGKGHTIIPAAENRAYQWLSTYLDIQ